jgi:sugar phosphate isomerase/epimerase
MSRPQRGLDLRRARRKIVPPMTPRFLRLRSFVVFAGALLAFACNGHADSAPSGPQLGLQSWTCRNMTFEQVADFAAAHHLKYIEFISPAHLDHNAPADVSLKKKALLESKGLVAYSFGVVRPGKDKAANRKFFEFARLMGMKVIAIEPPNQPDIWDDVEALVKEFDIKVAIHNHGTGTVYGNPETVKKVLATRDHRIGVCLDIGWVTAAGFDAAKVFREYGDRVYDMHFKDKVIETSADGKKTPVDTEIGKGGANYADLFAEIKKSHWSGVMAIETDSKAFAEDPSRLVDEAAKFFAARTGMAQK